MADGNCSSVTWGQRCSGGPDCASGAANVGCTGGPNCVNCWAVILDDGVPVFQQQAARGRAPVVHPRAMLLENPHGSDVFTVCVPGAHLGPLGVAAGDVLVSIDGVAAELVDFSRLAVGVPGHVLKLSRAGTAFLIAA